MRLEARKEFREASCLERDVASPRLHRVNRMSNRPTTGSVGTVRHLLSRYLGKLFSRRRTVALAAAVVTLAALACSGGPPPTPTPIPLPELTAGGAIEAVRDYLSTASYGGDLSCLEVLEGAGLSGRRASSKRAYGS